MNVTSLNHKTVRPGSLAGYSYYHSNRRPLSVTKAAPQLAIHTKWLRRGLALALILLVLIVGPLLRGYTDPAKQTASNSVPTLSTNTTTPKAAPTGSGSGAPAAAPATVNHCAGNKLDTFVLVSINQRHLWACQGSQSVYDSPVVTGIDYLAADKTPVGTYQVYDKKTNVTLAGSDTTGSWSDPVQYWMPFLHNQYGSYGFHDATWRDNSAFGNISPNSADASHGCVELPLSTAKWLYGWIQVGTTVTVEN